MQSYIHLSNFQHGKCNQIVCGISGTIGTGWSSHLGVEDLDVGLDLPCSS